MDPLTGIGVGGMALSGAADVYKMISGIRQTRKGRRVVDDLFDRQRSGEFNYSTPEQAFQSANLAKSMYLNQDMPGQTAAENKLQANTGQGVDMAKAMGRTPAEIMATISSLNENQNEGFTNLATAAGQQQIQDTLNYQAQLGTLADYKDKEWMYNTYMPFMQEMQYGQSLVGAGNKNIFGGVQDLGSLMMSMSMGGEDNPLAKLFSKRSGFKPNTKGNLGAYNETDRIS